MRIDHFTLATASAITILLVASTYVLWRDWPESLGFWIVMAVATAAWWYVWMIERNHERNK